MNDYFTARWDDEHLTKLINLKIILDANYIFIGLFNKLIYQSHYICVVLTAGFL